MKKQILISLIIFSCFNVFQNIQSTQQEQSQGFLSKIKDFTIKGMRKFDTMLKTAGNDIKKHFDENSQLATEKKDIDQSDEQSIQMQPQVSTLQISQPTMSEKKAWLQKCNELIAKEEEQIKQFRSTINAIKDIQEKESEVLYREKKIIDLTAQQEKAMLDRLRSSWNPFGRKIRIKQSEEKIDNLSHASDLKLKQWKKQFEKHQSDIDYYQGLSKETQDYIKHGKAYNEQYAQKHGININ